MHGGPPATLLFAARLAAFCAILRPNSRRGGRRCCTYGKGGPNTMLPRCFARPREEGRALGKLVTDDVLYRENGLFLDDEYTPAAHTMPCGVSCGVSACREILQENFAALALQRLIPNGH